MTQPRPTTSEQRFPDGGAWRVEIPSVKGPRRARERVSRARLALDLLASSGCAPLPMSGHDDPSLPVPPRFPAPQNPGPRTLEVQTLETAE